MSASKRNKHGYMLIVERFGHKIVYSFFDGKDSNLCHKDSVDYSFADGPHRLVLDLTPRQAFKVLAEIQEYNNVTQKGSSTSLPDDTKVVAFAGSIIKSIIILAVVSGVYSQMKDSVHVKTPKLTM